MNWCRTVLGCVLLLGPTAAQAQEGPIFEDPKQLTINAPPALPEIIPENLDALEDLRESGELDTAAADNLAAWLEDPVNLNTASRSALTALPGMTPHWADVVIANRPYADVAQFMALEDFPEGLAAELQGLVTVGVPTHWRGDVGTAWRSEAGVVPFAGAQVSTGGVWDLGAHVAFPKLDATAQPGKLPSGWAALGAAQVMSAHAAARWAHWQATLGDFTAGFAEGVTFDLAQRPGPAGWYGRGPPTFNPRSGWRAHRGLLGAALQGQAGVVQGTALAAWWPQPLVGGAVGVGLGPVKATAVGYVSAAAGPSKPTKAGRRGRVLPTGPTGAVGLAVQGRVDAWDLAAEGSRGLPAGWAAQGRVLRSLSNSVWTTLTYRGTTADFRNAYQRGGLRAPWYRRNAAGWQLHWQQRGAGLRSAVDVSSVLPWRLRWSPAVWWGVSPYEVIRLGGAWTPQGKVPWSVRASLSEKRWRRLPWTLSAGVHAQRQHVAMRVGWRLLEQSGITVGGGMARTGGGMLSHFAAVDAHCTWDMWVLRARGWWGTGNSRNRHGVVVQLHTGF